MSSPVIAICPQDQWTKVCSNVTYGQLFRLTKETGPYLYTYRLSQYAAPTDISEGVQIFKDSDVKVLQQFAFPVDIYIWVSNAPGS